MKLYQSYFINMDNARLFIFAHEKTNLIRLTHQTVDISFCGAENKLSLAGISLQKDKFMP